MTLFLLSPVLAATAQISKADSILVRIRSLDLIQTATANNLNWTVACSTEYAVFDIQRSTDAIHYTTIQKMTADKVRCRDPFEYADKTVPAVGRVFYRLQAEGTDGKLYSSRIVAAFAGNPDFAITSMFPTTVRDNAIVTIAASSDMRVQLTVNGPGGQLYQKQVLTLLKGNNDVHLYLASLEPGYFTVAVMNPQGARKLMRFVKQ